MKINKLISIDYEIAEKLKKESNASKLINDLLKENYSGGVNTKENMKKRIVEQQKILKNAQKELDVLEPKLEKLNKEASRPRLMSQIPHGTH